MAHQRRKLVILARGGEKRVEGGREIFPGGSGFVHQVRFTRTSPPVLDADILAVISDINFGGVWWQAQRLKIPFFHMDSTTFTAEEYQELIFSRLRARPDHITLSGWLKPVRGLPTEMVSNMHPALLPYTAGTYGVGANQTLIQLIRDGVIPPETAIQMHFVPPYDEVVNGKAGYDVGPAWWRFPIQIPEDIDIHGPNAAKELQQYVLPFEWAHQAEQVNRVLRGEVHLSRQPKEGGGFEYKVHYADHHSKRVYFPF